MPTFYDAIGKTYADRRHGDPRIASAIESAIEGCDSILNVGAGTGSYEPRTARIIGAEPSRTMIAQRPVGAAPCVQSRAEALPFRDNSFDAVLAILTVHHWRDQSKGLLECLRVARSRVVLFTNDFDVCAKFWLFDYVPALLQADRHLFISMAQYKESFGPVEIRRVPIPADCQDGFLGAYWKRPTAYLDPLVRESISAFSKIGNVDAPLARLRHDIASGEWVQRYADLISVRELDLGYRIVVIKAQRQSAPD
jgi:SAM-dependent methyltransferase